MDYSNIAQVRTPEHPPLSVGSAQYPPLPVGSTHNPPLPRGGLGGVVTVFAITIALVGCMKRKETLTIAPDGATKVQIEYEADSHDELYAGDAMPSPEGGWKTDLTVTKEQDGKDTYTLTAEAAFAPGQSLPDSFAVPSDPEAGLYARFPTIITREERSDGTYYHFHRIYPRRDWSQVETLRKLLVEDQVKHISEKEADEVTHEERVELVKALTQAAMMNLATHARSAFRDATPDAPQDTWLRAETALKTLCEGMDFERLATIMEDPDKEKSDAALAQEASAFEASALHAVVASLVDSGYTRTERDAFLERYNWHRRYYDITGDLGDDTFEIEVQMPGEVIVADMLATVEGGKTHWSFDGQLFRDRDLELMATSRVPPSTLTTE